MVLSASVRRRRSMVAFTVGLVAGGAITGTCLAVAAAVVRPPLTPPWNVVLMGAVCAALLSQETGLINLRLPQRRRLVPFAVFRLGPIFGPLEFGVEMGTGLRTYVSSAAPYAVVAAALLTAESLDALAAGVGFGLGRAAMTTASVLSRDTSAWDRQWADHARVIKTGIAVVATFTLLAQVQGW
jgi:hypothetical protein